MAPPSLWSGNLRLSLVLIPVKLCPAVSNEEAVSFRMIHEPSRKPIRYVKGVHEGDQFMEVPEEEIIKGYEHAKGHHVLIHPKELDELKLEAKHTIDMVRFVDEAEIDSRFWEKPYYLVPDGDDADEGYTVIRDALKQTARSLSASSLCMAVGTWWASRRSDAALCFRSCVTATKSAPPSLISTDSQRSRTPSQSPWRAS